MCSLVNLQKLWLQGNAIERLDALSAVPRLRELWLQENAIKSLAGIEVLSSLQVRKRVIVLLFFIVRRSVLCVMRR